MQIKYGSGPCATQQDDHTFEAEQDMLQRFQLQHLPTTRDIKEPEDAAVDLNFLGRLGRGTLASLSVLFWGGSTVDTRRQMKTA